MLGPLDYYQSINFNFKRRVSSRLFYNTLNDHVNPIFLILKYLIEFFILEKSLGEESSENSKH